MRWCRSMASNSKQSGTSDQFTVIMGTLMVFLCLSSSCDVCCALKWTVCTAVPVHVSLSYLNKPVT